MADWVDIQGAANLLAAIIEQARRDAHEPKLCSSRQRDSLRQDAQQFLAVVVEPAAAECIQDVIVPYRRRPVVAGLRWEFTETDNSRRLWRSRH